MTYCSVANINCNHVNRYEQRIAELEQQRDGAVAILEQTLCGISFGELRKAYAAYRAGEKYETVVDRIEAELISTKQQRGELLAALEGVLPFLTSNYWPGVEADSPVDRAVAIVRKVEAIAKVKP